MRCGAFRVEGGQIMSSYPVQFSLPGLPYRRTSSLGYPTFRRFDRSVHPLVRLAERVTAGGNIRICHAEPDSS